LLRHLRRLRALPQQPVGFPQLPDDLLRRMPASALSHRSDCPPRPTWAARLSQRADRSQGVGSEGRRLFPRRRSSPKLGAQAHSFAGHNYKRLPGGLDEAWI
jgi:hypothetical protein